jgi:phospholipid/cholesterol/gamma-HCH transport system substrate-binding protein
MKLSAEAKIGIIGIVTIAVLIWGINYLKGRNILTNHVELEAYLDHARGLESSTPVLMNGIKIGYVRAITLRTNENPPIKCELAIEKAYPLGSGSTAVIHSADLLGTKAIRIELSGAGFPLKTGDTIQIISEPDMLASLQDQLTPIMDRVGSLAVSIDSMVTTLERAVDSEDIRAIFLDLRGISSSLDQTLAQGGPLHQSFANIESFTTMLTEQEEELAHMSEHISSFSESLDNAKIDRLSENLIRVTDQFEIMLSQINSGEGTAGKLLYTDSLYHSLEVLLTDLDLLIRDLNENPQDYVHFSLFGKSQKEKEQKQEK